MKRASNVAALSLSFALIGSTAFAVGASITNADFETGSPGDEAIDGWTKVESRIDLGVTEIAGCTTVDTSDYSQLRDYAANWESEFGLTEDAGEPPQDPTEIDDGAVTLDGGESWGVDLADASGFGDPFTRESQVLSLVSDMYSMDTDDIDYGYVVHGPAVYSDPFTARTIDDLSFAWAAQDEEDDYAIVGYLLNTSSCEWTEVVDSTGEVSDGWSEATVAIPAAATYRFVFISGTFDYSFGGAAGAYLYLDDFVLAPNEERAAAAAAASSSEEEAGPPGIFLTVTGRVGYLFESSEVVYGAYAVAPNSAYQLSVQSISNPTLVNRVLASGRVNSGGHLEATTALPRLAGGNYKITLIGTAANGIPLKLTNHVNVDATGKYTSISAERLQPYLP